MGLIRYLFFEKKHLAYTAFGQDMYYKACNKLSQGDVQYDAVRKMTTSLFDTSRQTAIPSTRNQEIDNAQYDFYVRKEDEHRAQQALR
ncbi:hypothetical protein DHX103_10890 [Planococcus sp. X10-3]|uniref:hypothetical protein n=1 Tax=Planococcus sp. X10-3 TaxID=3061240 RepID=UPI003BB1B93C